MPPSPTAIAILEFGKLIHDEERRYKKDRDGAKIQQAEEKLIGMLVSERSPSIKQIFNFNVGKPVEPIVVRVLSPVAYLSLCSNRLGIAVNDIVRAVAGKDPAAVLEARQTISKLLIAKQLCLKNGYNIELGRPLLDFLAGGTQSPPLVMTECDLDSRWQKAQADAKRKTKVPIESLPTAKFLTERISQHVVGLDSRIRTLSCRLALHLRRAGLIQAGNDPGSPNECLLFLDPRGQEKLFWQKRPVECVVSRSRPSTLPR